MAKNAKRGLAVAARPVVGRWTAAEGFPLVERWRSSGLTQTAFAAREGVTTNRLQYWISQWRSAATGIAPASPAMRFVEAKVTQMAMPQEPGRAADALAVPVAVHVGRELVCVQMAAGVSGSDLTLVLRAALEAALCG